MQQGSVHSGGRPGGQSRAHKAGEDGGEQNRLFHITVPDVGGQSRGGRGQKVEQVDALSLVLGDTGKGGQIDEQQGAASHPKAGQDAGKSPCQNGGQPAHQKNRAFTPP